MAGRNVESGICVMGRCTVIDLICSLCGVVLGQFYEKEGIRRDRWSAIPPRSVLMANHPTGSGCRRRYARVLERKPRLAECPCNATKEPSQPGVPVSVTPDDIDEFAAKLVVNIDDTVARTVMANQASIAKSLRSIARSMKRQTEIAERMAGGR